MNNDSVYTENLQGIDHDHDHNDYDKQPSTCRQDFAISQDPGTARRGPGQKKTNIPRAARAGHRGGGVVCPSRPGSVPQPAHLYHLYHLSRVIIQPGLAWARARANFLRSESRDLIPS